MVSLKYMYGCDIRNNLRITKECEQWVFIGQMVIYQMPKTKVIKAIQTSKQYFLNFVAKTMNLFPNLMLASNAFVSGPLVSRILW